MPVGPQETVLVPVGSRVLCAGVIAVALVVVVALVVRGDAALLLRSLPAIALAIDLSLILFWLPRVRVGPAEIEVENPFRSYRVTWPAIREVGTRWAMTLYTTAGRIEAWAVPAPGPLTGGGLPFRDSSGRVAPDPARHHRAPGSAQIVRRQWEAYRDAGSLGAVEGDGVTRRWHPVRIAVTVLLTAVTLLTIALR